jgi:hypothetical protein
LRSRRQGEVATAPGRSGALTSRLLGRIGPAIADGFMTRAEREAEDEAFLAEHDDDPARTPHVLSVRPDPDSPVPSRLERDMDIVRGGLEAGRRAALRALEGVGTQAT